MDQIITFEQFLKINGTDGNSLDILPNSKVKDLFSRYDLLIENNRESLTLIEVIELMEYMDNRVNSLDFTTYNQELGFFIVNNLEKK